MTKKFSIAAVTAIGLSAVDVTASYAEHGQGSSTQENRSLQSIAAQQAGIRGPETANSLQGNQQAISGLLGATASAKQGIVPQGSNVGVGGFTRPTCATTTAGRAARVGGAC
jgi:hypothetical protein